MQNFIFEFDTNQSNPDKNLAVEFGIEGFDL